MSINKRVIFVSYTHDEKETLSRPVEDILASIIKLPLRERDYQLPRKEVVAMRLHSWEKKGDYFAGSAVLYTDSAMTTGSEDSESLERFKLPIGKKIVQVTLFLYFPQSKIFSVLYNHSGVRYSAIITYLNIMQQKLGCDPVVYLKPKIIMHPNVHRLIDKKQISLATLAVSRDKIPTLEDKSSLFAGFAYLGRFTSRESVIEVTIKKRPYDRNSGDVLNSNPLFDMVGSNDVDELRNMYEKVSVKVGEEVVNVLQEKYESIIKVDDYSNPDNHGKVHEEMYRNYQANRERLAEATNHELD